MMETVSFGLMGLSVLVALISYLGAHRTPLPDFSKIGCLAAVGIGVVGFIAGLAVPVTQYRTCGSECTSAMHAGMTGDYGEYEEFVDTSRDSLAGCIKGAKQANRKAKAAADEAGDPSLHTPLDMAEVEKRCKAIAVTQCTDHCYTPDAVR
jgi:hypothetical protein